MIPKETIDEIFETARIEEVVGDFVQLRKRGVNLIGVCPFHDEKTPSFTVSPAKGIYKCFGCQVGGNAINFVMAHEQYSYPEALRFLAKKYNIFIEEKKLTPQEIVEKSERESLYIVSTYAQEFFTEQLLNSEKGKAIGLSYFKERGFTEEIIKKFDLGYCPDDGNAFVKAAQENGYGIDFIKKLGLGKDRNGSLYDGYKGRVIFPIQNLSGKTIGFGGRTLVTSKKVPKYVNTPECDIYHKSKVLYGLNRAKTAIIKQDNCFLVEGYTDVISLHQTGIENVVSSSGTALTKDQIKLINRYTPNITILFDGDVAGIKASFRGIDLILEEGMNVKVVLFPEGEDPDSYAKKLGSEDLNIFLEANAKDFIVFKTDLLLAESENDPIKKTQLIRQIVESVALVPDSIARGQYLKACSKILDTQENILIQEVNKIIRRKTQQAGRGYIEDPVIIPPEEATVFVRQNEIPVRDVYYQEKDVIRLILNYGGSIISIDGVNDEGETEEQKVRLSDYVVFEILNDELAFENQTYQLIFNHYIEAFNEETEIDSQQFVREPEADIQEAVIELMSSKHELHNWESKNIAVTLESDNLRKAAIRSIYAFKARKVEKMWEENQKKMKTLEADDAGLMTLLKEQMRLETLKSSFSKEQGRVIVK